LNAAHRLLRFGHVAKERALPVWKSAQLRFGRARRKAERTSQDDLKQRVSQRAYFLWLEAGRPEGRAEEFWAEAAKQEAGSWFKEFKDTFAAYEAGKKRRYELLFAVNGGVLAIASFSPVQWRTAVLAGIMVAFTITMAYDIWHFGDRFFRHDQNFFGEAGRSVLWSICLILCLAWIGLFVESVVVMREGISPAATTT
jgi:hypothetical protein